jgi:hypothetical protein
MTVPNTFVPGGVVASAAINENFATLDAQTAALRTDLASTATGKGDTLVMQSNGQTARSNSPLYIWRKLPSLVGGGTAGTATENALRLQAQIDALSAAGGGILKLVEDVIQIDRPIIIPEKVSVIRPGANRCLLQNTYSYSFRQSSVIMPGNFHPAFTGTGSGATGGLWGDANSKALAAFTAGSFGVTLSVAPSAGDFLAGDTVIVFDPVNYYVSGGNKISYYMALRRVTSVAGSIVYLDEALRDAVAAGAIYNLRTGTLLGPNILAASTDTRRKLFAWGDGQIAGFSADTVGYWISDSAVYKGEFSDIEIERSRAIHYGNT